MINLGRPINDFIRGQAPGSKGTNPALNIGKGGMWGALPDFSSWVNNAPYVQQHGVLRLIRAPGAFKEMADGDIYAEYLKNLIEIKRKRIEGISLNIDVSFSEIDLDGSGRMMHTPSDAKRSTSDFSITWDELQGCPIGMYWKEYCSLFLVDPDIKKARITSLLNMPDMLPDMQSFACIAYETDTTNRFVTKAVLIENCMPENNGGALEIMANKSSEMEQKEISITFKNWTLDTTEVYEAAQELHDEISRTLIDPNRSKMGIDGIEADISRIASGYKETLEEISG